ncbi:MAG: phosphopantetheine-binding protein [Verrucomicrobiota bacterium]|nr:phosphopantetheine-binding protein [Limisphaera sp.]MDW8380812.1 phosphopantetheine-binding protein [Verrucomicrobiota bacterium]
METQARIERFIAQDILAGSRSSIGATENLVGMGGLLDSLGLLRLIQFLEEEFQIQIGDGDVREENFGTLERLAAFVARKENQKSV